MSSRRFPGKVLAPFRGRPVIAHVIDAVTAGLPAAPLVVVTSRERSDDPLAAYVAALGIPVVRGALDDVFARFLQGLDAFPCEWVMRVSADSPLMDPGVLQALAGCVSGSSASLDLVTTIYPRSFPNGRNAELIRAAALRAVATAELTDHDREHVTPFFYRHPERFAIRNVSSGAPHLAEISLAIDTPEDLVRLERLADEELNAMAATIHL
jgi:spore coat polysaccharide biosynthesis protein SpsF